MKTRHKVAAGGLTAGTIALAAAMYNHWEGRNYVAVHLAFDPPGVVTVCGGITTHDISTLRVGDRYSEADCEKLIERVIPRYAAPVQACIPGFTAMPPHRQAGSKQRQHRTLSLRTKDHPMPNLSAGGALINV